MKIIVFVCILLLVIPLTCSTDHGFKFFENLNSSGITSNDESAVIIGFDCNQTEPEILAVSTLDITPCPELSKLVPQVSSVYGQIIQHHELDIVHIVTCQLTESKFYFRCGGSWINYNVYPPSIGNVKEISAAKCKEIHTSGFYKYDYNREPWSNLSPNKTYHFSVNLVGWTDSKGYCDGGTVSIGGQQHNNIVVQVSYTLSLRESWAMVDRQSNTVNIERSLACPYLKGQCIDALTGTHSWTPLAQKCPEDLYRLLYQGQINITRSSTDPTVLLSINKPPFFFTSELGSKSHTCNLDMYLTEFPNVFYLEQQSGTFQVQLPPPSQSDIKFLTYLNAKMTFMYHNLHDSIQKMYIDSLHETCKVEREMLKNRIEIIRLNSASGGLSSLLKPGMFAKVNGEVIHLIKCKPVSVQFRQETKCYEALPVLYKNSKYFILPNTHILTPFSSQIICSPITPVTYKIGGRWWSFSGSFVQTIAPVELSPSTQFYPKFNKIRSFSRGGMYSEEQMEAVQKTLIFPQLREAVTTEFIRGITKYSTSKVSLDITSVMSEADWRTLAKKNIEKAWGYFATVGNTISGFIGIYFIYRICKGALNALIDGKDLYNVFGCSLYLMSAIWGRLAQYFINRASTGRSTQTTPTTTGIECNIELQEVAPQSTNQDDELMKYLGPYASSLLPPPQSCSASAPSKTLID